MSKEKDETVSRVALASSEKKRKLPKVKRRFKIGRKLLISVSLIIAGIVLLQIAQSISRNDSAFVIDGRGYSKQKISAMVTYGIAQDHLTKKQEAKKIYDLYMTQVATKKADIVPNDSEIKAAKATLKYANKASGSTETEYVNLVAYNGALDATYQRYARGGYHGYEFVFDFSAKFIARRSGSVPGQGDQAAIDDDRSFAEQQAQAAYKSITKKHIAFDVLDKQLRAASKSGYLAGGSAIDSNKPVSLQAQVFYPDIYKYVLAQQKPITSEVRVGRVPTTFAPKPIEYKEGYYYFVVLDKAKPVVSDPIKKVADQKQKLHGVYHGI